MEDKKIRIGITHGDTNGVGYEVILRALESPTILELCTPIIYGSPKVAIYHRKAMELNTNFTTIASADEAQDGRVNMVEVIQEEVKVDLGQGTPEAGQAALQSLEAAMRDWKEGKIDVLVTAPINKKTIQSPEFHFPGHTEYIQACAGDGQEALMVLMNEDMRIALVTTHLPISQVAQGIKQENILSKLRIFNDTLKRDFLISGPRIAVLALNPHAGDNGLLGSEEKDIILPAMQQAEAEHINCFGPYPADGFFGTQMYRYFDGVLAMYHDQGLAPFKAIAMESGVNYTAGLPIIRTSPDHGTAYDIAGQGKADPTSMLHAIYTAIDVYRNRASYEEAHQHPLPKLYHDKRDNRE